MRVCKETGPAMQLYNVPKIASRLSRALISILGCNAFIMWSQIKLKLGHVLYSPSFYDTGQ